MAEFDTAAAPTEMVPGVAAGALLHDVAASFPAAATTVTPSAIRVVIFVSKLVGRLSKPMLMFTTARPVVWCEITQSRPAFAMEVSPLPQELRMRTG